MYGAVFQPSLDAAFRAAEAHGIRAVIGKVMMDRGSYDDTLSSARVLDASLRAVGRPVRPLALRDDGRLRYAFTPRFALSCGPDMLRGSAELARETGAYWQTHVAEDRNEIREVARRSRTPSTTSTSTTRPAASGRGRSSPTRSTCRRARSPASRRPDSAIAHCPASNLFLASGAMPLARYRRPGSGSGLGSDVAAGPELSIFANMRAGGYIQSGLRVLAEERGEHAQAALDVAAGAHVGEDRELRPAATSRPEPTRIPAAR